MNLTPFISIAAIGHALLFFCIGALIGCAHFTALRWNTQLFVNNGPLWRAIALQLTRMVVTSMALLGCAYAGALPLVAALAGLLLARQFILRKLRVA